MAALVGVLVLVLAALGAQGAPLSQEQRSKLSIYHSECLAKTGVDVSLVKQAKKGEFSENAKLKDYLFCISQKIGFQDENGELQKDVLKQKLGNLVRDFEEASKLVEKCAVQQRSPQDTAYHVIKCYYDSSPNHIVIFTEVILSEEKSQKLLGYHRDCVSETGVEEKLIINAKKRGEFSQDAKFKDYLFCLSKKIGFQNGEGEIQQNVITEKIIEFTKDEKLAQQLLDKCALKQDTSQNTAYFLIKCYYDNTPIHVQLFPERKVIRLPGEKAEILVKYYKECVADTGVDESLIKKARRGDYSIDDPKLREYALCMSKKVGIINESGEIQKEVLKKKMALLIEDQAMADRLLEKCALQKDTPQDTAYYAMKCYYENSSARISVLEALSINDEQKEKYKAYCRACAAETGVKRELVNSAKKGQFSDDPVFKAYVLCMSKKFGYILDNGDIQRDVAKQTLTEKLKDDELVAKVMDKCLVKKDTPEDTAFESSKCFYENTPKRFHY